MILNFVKTTNLLDWGRLTFGQMAAELQNVKDMAKMWKILEGWEKKLGEHTVLLYCVDFWEVKTTSYDIIFNFTQSAKLGTICVLFFRGKI